MSNPMSVDQNEFGRGGGRSVRVAAPGCTLQMSASDDTSRASAGIHFSKFDSVTTKRLTVEETGTEFVVITVVSTSYNNSVVDTSIYPDNDDDVRMLADALNVYLGTRPIPAEVA